MLTTEQRETVEGWLRREREDAKDALRHFDESSHDLREQTGELSLQRFHMADVGTEMMEREKEFLLASKEGRRLYEIDEALRRLYRDPEQFGMCERCGRQISMERLEVLPETRFCAEDAVRLDASDDSGEAVAE